MESRRIGPPYHSPSAEGHTIHTVVGRGPAPTIPITAPRLAISAVVAHTTIVSHA